MRRYLHSDAQPPGLRTVLLITIVAFAMLWALSDDADGASAPMAKARPLCASPIVRDYEAPLRALPPASPLPRQLPFAPAGLAAWTLRGSGENLVYAGTAAGLVLSATGGPAQPDWTVRLVVSRPAVDGSASTPVAETLTRVESVQPGYSMMITVGPLGEAGTFRIDTTFSDQAGNTLGSYFEYVQVVPETLQVRLALSRRVIPPDGTLKMRIENLGTTHIGYGYPYGLERYLDHHWQPVPGPGPFLLPLLGLQAGRAGVCQTVEIPKGAKPGLYRVRKGIQPDFGRPAEAKIVGKTFRIRARR